MGTKINFTQNTLRSCTTVEECKVVGTKVIAEVRKIIDEKLLRIEQNHPNSRAFLAGTCHLCPAEECTRIIGESCRYPDKIRPSLESFGFDVGKTTEKLLSIELRWGHDGLLPEYLTLVSGLFTNNAIIGLHKYFSEK